MCCFRTRAGSGCVFGKILVDPPEGHVSTALSAGDMNILVQMTTWLLNPGQLGLCRATGEMPNRSTHGCAQLPSIDLLRASVAAGRTSCSPAGAHCCTTRSLIL